MPAEWTLHAERLDVPPASGVPGVLRAVESILKLGRVQRVEIGLGHIDYEFYLPAGATLVKKPKFDADELMPFALARQQPIVELVEVSEQATSACLQLFQRAAQEQMVPLAFLGSAGSPFWAWAEKSSGVRLPDRGSLFGIPFLADRMMEESALLLCTGYRASGTMADTVKSYKIAIPVLP